MPLQLELGSDQCSLDFDRLLRLMEQAQPWAINLLMNTDYSWDILSRIMLVVCDRTSEVKRWFIKNAAQQINAYTNKVVPHAFGERRYLLFFRAVDTQLPEIALALLKTAGTFLTENNIPTLLFMLSFNKDMQDVRLAFFKKLHETKGQIEAKLTDLIFKVERAAHEKILTSEFKKLTPEQKRTLVKADFLINFLIENYSPNIYTEKSFHEMVDDLLGFGADFFKQDKEGNTVLHKAVMNEKHWFLLSLLLKSRSTAVDIKNYRGKTPLDLLLKCKNKNSAVLTEALKEVMKYLNVEEESLQEQLTDVWLKKIEIRDFFKTTAVSNPAVTFPHKRPAPMRFTANHKKVKTSSPSTAANASPPKGFPSLK